MALDGLFIYRLFSMYVFIFIGLWWVLYSEDDADENAFPVDYRPIWLVALIGLFASFSIMQGVGSRNSGIDDDAKIGRAAMNMKLSFERLEITEWRDSCKSSTAPCLAR